MKTASCALLLLVAAFGEAQIRLDSVAADVAHHEMLFSCTSAVKGRNQAFVEYLDDSCMTFNPVPVLAKPIYRASKSGQSILTWQPECIEVSSSADIAYSTGPWELRPSKLSDIPISVGHYFSIWKYSSDGWKVIFDHGTNSPEGRNTVEKLQYIVPSSRRRTVADKEFHLSSFQSKEVQFTHEAQFVSLHSAYKVYAAKNIRMFRDQTSLLKGKATVLRKVSQDTVHYRYIPWDSRISTAGDLGYAFGLAVSSTNDTCAFVRVWRKEKAWEIAIDMLNSIR